MSPAPRAKPIAAIDAASARGRVSLRPNPLCEPQRRPRSWRSERRDAIRECRRCGLERGGAADRPAQGLEPTVLRRQRRIGRKLALEFERAHRIEFAVKGGVEPQGGFGFVSHGSGFSILVSAARARARRDMTVPIGAPVASAMSR